MQTSINQTTVQQSIKESEEMVNLVSQFEGHSRDPPPLFHECEEDEYFTALDEEEPVFHDALGEINPRQDGTTRGEKGRHTSKNLAMMAATMCMTMTSVTACDVTSLNN